MTGVQTCALPIWLTGQVLRVVGNTVMRVAGYSIDTELRSASGEALTVDELRVGMRKLFKTYPTGIPAT